MRETRDEKCQKALKCGGKGAKSAKMGKRRQKKIIFDGALRHDFWSGNAKIGVGQGKDA